MITKAVPSMRLAVEKSGYVPKEEENFQFLIGVAGTLFEIASDYTVLINSDKIYGIGSGAAYGVGALAVGADIEAAMKVSIKFDIFSGGKIQIVKQGASNA